MTQLTEVTFSLETLAIVEENGDKHAELHGSETTSLQGGQAHTLKHDDM